MNKIMLFSMAALISLGGYAQSVSGSIDRATLGITGGVNWNTINGKSSTGTDLDNKSKTGFNGGVNAEFPIGGGFYLQPGVEYRMKGTEYRTGDKLTLSYIDVPVTILYKPALGTGSVLLGFGPYAGFGIAGKVTAPNGTERDVKFSNSWSATEAPDLQFKGFDAGANIMAGYEFRSKLSAAVKAQLGLVNINHERNDETRYRNTGFGVSLGYRL